MMLVKVVIGIGAGICFVVALILAAMALAHPGRLDDKNCHRVKEDWRYESGKVLKKGAYHCHGKLNDMPLDGTQLLEDPSDRGAPVRKQKDKRK